MKRVLILIFVGLLPFVVFGQNETKLSELQLWRMRADTLTYNLLKDASKSDALDRSLLALKFGNQSFEKSDKGVFLKQGFDFRALLSHNPDLNEPKVGTKINLADLQTSRREMLSGFGNEELLLFAVVAPDCAACKFSEDMMQNIRKTTNELGIKYLPVVFIKNLSDADTQRYAESLGFETCVKWSSENPVPESLSTMVTPSHILTNRDGVVLQIWLGTNKDADTRKRMSGQISADLFLINDVVKAVKINNEIAKP